jgi:hypothetical protein
MKILTAVIALSLLGVGGAEARSWFGNRKLPKPIDSPIVRVKVKEHHKPGNRQRHPKGPSPFSWHQPASSVERA